MNKTKLFAHFFDLHFLAEKGVDFFRKEALFEMRLAIRVGILAADQIVIPAASYYESDLCRQVLDEFGGDEAGANIFLTASAANLDEFVEDKKEQYSPRSDQGHVYHAFESRLILPWRKRLRGATADIASDWRGALESGQASQIVASLSRRLKLPSDHEVRWAAVPERLDGKAFIVGNVAPLLLGKQRLSFGAKNDLHGLINGSYFGSYVRDLQAAVYRNMSYLEPVSELVSGDPAHDIDYSAFLEACRPEGLLQHILRCKPADLLQLRHSERLMTAWERYKASQQQQAEARLFYVSGGLAGGTVRIPAPNVAVETVAGLRANIIQGRHMAETTDSKSLQVLVVSALPIEAAAIRATVDAESEVFGEARSGNIYRICTYNGLTQAKRSRSFLHVLLSTMGKTSAAAATVSALGNHPSVQHIFMVGIAGGCPDVGNVEGHVRLGDVVVSDDTGILEFDDVKRHPDRIEIRGSPQRPSQALLQAFRQLQSDELLGSRPWDATLDRALERLPTTSGYSRPLEVTDVLHAGDQVIPHPHDLVRLAGRPRIFGGGVGTSDTLLKDAGERERLRKEHGIKAVEMEGSAVQDAAWASSKDVMVVRGVCDYADQHKNKLWQPYAALTAAAYARSLIEAMPGAWFAEP